MKIDILPTCRLIHDEAHVVLLKTMRKALAKCSLQILLCLRGNYLDMIVVFLSALKEHVRRLCKDYGPRGSRDK
jgi:hypothetical protein